MSTKVSKLNIKNLNQKEEDSWEIIDHHVKIDIPIEVNNEDIKKKGLVRRVSKKLLSPRKNSGSKE